MFEIVEHVIDEQAVAAAVADPAAGAICTFSGVVRSNSRGKRVLYLEYEAYPEMAIKQMQQIAAEMREKWTITGVAIVHRTGRLEIGEASVCLAVSSPHRGDAFEACRYAIDRLKQTVPVWKKEVWEGGEYWVGWEGTPDASLHPAPSPDDDTDVIRRGGVVAALSEDGKANKR
jgi:molybdopterin synthase catalytic subunit